MFKPYLMKKWTSEPITFMQHVGYYLLALHMLLLACGGDIAPQPRI